MSLPHTSTPISKIRVVNPNTEFHQITFEAGLVHVYPELSKKPIPVARVIYATARGNAIVD